mgnify:CR=1 FL=1
MVLLGVKEFQGPLSCTENNFHEAEYLLSKSKLKNQNLDKIFESLFYRSLSTGTKWITNSIRPVFNLLFMMDEYDWEDYLTLTILTELSPKFESAFESDLSYIKSENLVYRVKTTLPKLVQLAKPKFPNVEQIISRVFSNKYFGQSEPLTWQYPRGKSRKYISAFL